MFSLIFKANPYRDAAGKFTTKDRDTSGGLLRELDGLRRGGVGVALSNKDWAEHGGSFTPSDLIKVSTGSAHGSGERGVSVGDDGGVTYVQNGGKAFGAEVVNVQRTYYAKLGVVEHNYLKLKDEEQGSGAVKEMFRTSLPLYEKHGVKRIDLHANLDMGAYAWGRYGFTAKDPDEFRSEYQKGMVRLSEEAKRLGIELSDEARSELRGLRKSLLDHQGSKYITHTMTDAKTPVLDWELRELFPDSRMTYTKAVLKDAHWRGEIDLKDEVAMKRLHKYIAKKSLDKD